MEQWIDLGGVECRLVTGGRFALDAGGMFGIIPRALWSRHYSTDEAGRMELEANCLLIRGEGMTALCDTGMGGKMSEKERAIFKLTEGEPLLESLRKAGIDPADVTHLLFTHLHMDHSGGATGLREGAPELLFPNAEILVQRREWEDALANRSHMTATYRADNLAPLSECGRLHLLDGTHELPQGITLLPSPGHTPGHQSILVRGEREALLFAGDVTPLAEHEVPPWNSAFDLDPLRSIATKATLLAQASLERWWWVYSHQIEDPVRRR